MNFFKGSWICFTSGGRVGNIGVARSFLFIRFLRFFLFGGGIICFTFPCEEEAARLVFRGGSFPHHLLSLPEAAILFFPFVSGLFFFFYFYFYSILLIP